MPQVPLSVREVCPMSLDEVYDRVDSVIKDMISLTNPNPVLN